MKAPQPKHGKTVHVVELRIPASAEWVSVARLAIAGIASRADLSLEDIEDLKLAVAEACTSYIHSATEDDVLCLVSELAADRITISVDATHDLASHAAGVARPEPLAGGLGDFLIRSLMDDVNYDFDEQGRPRLVMTKIIRS